MHFLSSAIVSSFIRTNLRSLTFLDIVRTCLDFIIAGLVVGAQVPGRRQGVQACGLSLQGTSGSIALVSLLAVIEGSCITGLGSAHSIFQTI